MTHGELLQFLLVQVGTAVSVYGAIRADLREALTRIAIMEKRMDRREG